MDRSIKELRNKKVSLVKVLWRNSQIEEETWERESEMMKKYPGLFSYIGMNLISRTNFFFGRGECNTFGRKIINLLISCKTKGNKL